MNDLKIKGVSYPAIDRVAAEGVERRDILQDFRKILKHSIEEVDGLSKEANHAAQEMMAGRMDVHEAMAAMERSGITFRLMVQVRNKMMAAYEEIMRMQV